MNALVVLAVHGVPPRDFPPAELSEFFGLHARIEAGGHGMQPAQTQHYRDLEVIVLTPMLTQGGEHAERDIPAAIDRARAAHPGVKFVYTWPFEGDAVIRLLAEQVRRFAG